MSLTYRNQVMDNSAFLFWEHHHISAGVFFLSSFDGKKCRADEIISRSQILKPLDYCALMMWMQPASLFCAAP